MTDLVDPMRIEDIVGMPRLAHHHVSVVIDKIMYIMHSQDCVDNMDDLRDCEWSIALDNGELVPTHIKEDGVLYERSY